MDIAATLDTIKKVFKGPKKFFEGVKKQKSWKDAFGVVLITAAIGHILAGAYAFIYSSTQSEPLALAQIIPAILISFVLTLGMSFVWGWALKIWLSIFKVETSFSRAFLVMAYSRIPNLLFSWLPFVNFFMAVFSFYLLMIGLESQYEIKRKKAIVIIVTSIIALFALSVLLFLIFPQV